MAPAGCRASREGGLHSLPQTVCGVAAGTTSSLRSSSCRCASQPSLIACMARGYSTELITMRMQTLKQHIHVIISLTHSRGCSAHIDRYSERCASLLVSYVEVRDTGSGYPAIEQILSVWASFTTVRRTTAKHDGAAQSCSSLEV